MRTIIRRVFESAKISAKNKARWSSKLGLLKCKYVFTALSWRSKKNANSSALNLICLRFKILICLIKEKWNNLFNVFTSTSVLQQFPIPICHMCTFWFFAFGIDASHHVFKCVFFKYRSSYFKSFFLSHFR